MVVDLACSLVDLTAALLVVRLDSGRAAWKVYYLAEWRVSTMVVLWVSDWAASMELLLVVHLAWKRVAWKVYCLAEKLVLKMVVRLALVLVGHLDVNSVDYLDDY